MSDLEKAVVRSVVEGLSTAISARLAIGYGDAPLAKMVDAVITRRSEEINAVMDDAFASALSGDLREEIKQAIRRKVARVLVSKMEGEIEKRVSELRQSPEFRAKVTLGLTQVVQNLQRESGGLN